MPPRPLPGLRRAALPGGASWRWLSLPLLVAAWQGAAAAIGQPLLPAPTEVGARLWALAAAGPFAADLTRTLWRSLAALLVALPAGIAIGVVLGRRPRIDELFSGWLVVGLNLPAIIVGLLVFIWLGLSDGALVLAVVISKVPLVAATVREGARSLRPEFDELGRAFRLSWMRRLLHVQWPQLLPFVLAAARNGLALIWKIVLVFEVLGSDGGVGFRVGIYFQHFDVTGILAYAAAFVGVVLLVEAALLGPLERHAMRWRPARG